MAWSGARRLQVQALPPRPKFMKDDLIYRLRKRAEIRRQIKTRKSVQEGKPDKIADLLEEAAAALEELLANKKDTPQ